MRRSLWRNLSGNFFQMLINQSSGIIFFILLSKALSKNEFGALNFNLSILLVLYSLLNFGFDQIIIRKIAGGGNSIPLVSIYLFHNLLTGIVFCAFIYFLRFSCQSNITFYWLFLLSIAKLFQQLTLPFKSLASGKERFDVLNRMSVIANLLRAIALAFCIYFEFTSYKIVVYIILFSDLGEFIYCTITGSRLLKYQDRTFETKIFYRNLLKETIPQLGVVILAATRARLDWIFIGIFSPGEKLADYSFSYKLFELSTLPLMIIAPVLVPMFSRNNHQMFLPNSNALLALIKAQLLVAVSTVIILNGCWVSVVNLMASAYAPGNSMTIFLLSLAIPLLYINNFLWSFHFADGNTNYILKLFASSFVVNIFLLFLLVPFLHNEGAAIAFLGATVCQTFFYLRKPFVHRRTVIIKLMANCYLIIAVSLGLGKMLFEQYWAMGLFGTFLVLILVFYFILYRKNEISFIKEAMSL